MVKIDTKEAITALRELNFVVVSLDHIGSAEMSEAQRRVETDEFVTHGKVFRRIAKVRALLAISIEEALSKSEVADLECRADEWPVWKIKRGLRQRKR